MRKILLLFFAFLICGYESFSQDFSNKGKDFWVGYGNHVRMFSTGTAETMEIYLTSDVNTTGNITVSSIGFSQVFNVIANQITVVNIPRTAALLDEGLYNHGIHITAVKPIVAYGFIYVNAISGATVYLPTNTLGKEYYSLNYRQISNQANSYSYFFVEATEPGTTVVEINPSQTTKGGWAANVTQTISLTQGQIYQVLSVTDLTGSTIKSIASGTEGCKKIAVFCGSGKISIGCANVGSTSTAVGSSDNLYQQMYPTSTWGKKYVLIPSENNQTALLPMINTNIFRIYRPDATAIVTLNGVILSSASFINNCYDFQSNETNLVESSKGILVSQYFTSANVTGAACPSGNANPHDPEMIYLNPIEQTITDVTVNSMQPASNTNINQHFINVVLRNAGTGVSSFKIDGSFPPSDAFTVLPQDNNYSYIRIWKNGGSTNLSDPALSLGAHRLTSDSGFNAIAYGFGTAESYGYSAGTNLKDLFQQISVQSQFGIENSPSVCTNSPFRFRVSLPYCADSIKWDLSGLPGPPSPSNPKVYYSKCIGGANGPDSTTLINGKILYWYSLPNIYTFPTAGLFPVTITAYNTGATQCGSAQDIDFELGVFDPPNAGFTNSQPRCVNEPVQFTDTTITAKPNYKWAWYFDDLGSGSSNTSTLQNPIHTFSTSGSHTVTLTTTTTVGCFSSAASKVINVPALVNATILSSIAVCQTAPPPNITFTITGGLSPYKINYTLSINGGAAMPQTPIITSTLINLLPVSTASVGTYTYSITSVENANAAFCTQLITGQVATVTVNPLPAAVINGSTTVCQNSANPTLTLSGSGGTSPYTFSYTINGGAPQTATTISGNSITVAAPTTTFGSFVYALTQVKDASSTQCIQTYTNTTATIIVKQLASATISGTTSVCQSSTSPMVTFTAVGGVAPYTFFYTLNGAAFTVITTVGSSVSVPVSTTTPATYTYVLQSVQESSSVSCTQLQSGSVVITIKPNPSASFTTTGPYCAQNTIDINPVFGITPTGSVVSWVWDYGDGVGTQTRPNGNPFTLNYPTAGNKIITFKTVSDFGCVSNLFTLPVVINSKPLAGFVNPASCLADAKAQFTDTSKVAGVGASIVYWEWNFGDGTPVFAGSGLTYKKPLHSYLVVGQKTVKLIVTSNSGCKDTVIQQFFINGEVTKAAFTTLSPNNLCSNLPVQIKDNSFVNVGGLIRVDIYWNYTNAPSVFDQDNSPTPGKIYTHSYPNLQTDQKYSIRYFAYSGFNGVCQKDTTINILVRASPVAQFISVPDVCLNGGPVVLTQGSSTGGTGVYMGAGVTFNAGVYTFNPLATGVTVGTNNGVIYTVTSPAGCDSAKVQRIKVLAPPVVNSFGPVGNTCQNTNINFNQTSTMSDGTIVKWIYNWNDGTPEQVMANGSAVSHLYITSGPHSATLTLETAYGCRNIPYAASFNVNPQPLPDFTFSPTACLPQARIDFLNITPPSLSTWSYKWYFVQNPANFLDSSTQQSPNHLYTSVGPHTVKLISTSPITGCTNSIIKEVNTIHKAPIANFNFDKPSICVAQSLMVLQNSTAEEGTLTAWSWNYGDNSTAVGLSPIPHTYSAIGTYNVKLTVTNSFGCVDDTIKQFVVYPYPLVNAGPDEVVLEGGTFNIVATATGNNLTYLWSSIPSPTYLSSITILNPLAKPVVDITYKLIVTAQGGCAKADSLFIKVLKFPEIPNSFTPNNDGVHDFWEIKYLFTYPGNKVQVFTRTGQLVFESKGYAKPWDGNMNGKSLPYDTYYYIIEPGSGRKPITGFVTIIK